MTKKEYFGIAMKNKSTGKLLYFKVFENNEEDIAQKIYEEKLKERDLLEKEKNDFIEVVFLGTFVDGDKIDAEVSLRQGYPEHCIDTTFVKEIFEEDDENETEEEFKEWLKKNNEKIPVRMEDGHIEYM